MKFKAGKLHLEPWRSFGRGSFVCLVSHYQRWQGNSNLIPLLPGVNLYLLMPDRVLQVCIRATKSNFTLQGGYPCQGKEIKLVVLRELVPWYKRPKQKNQAICLFLPHRGGINRQMAWLNCTTTLFLSRHFLFIYFQLTLLYYKTSFSFAT